MQALPIFALRFFLWFVSRIPLTWLYGVSDALYFIIYKGFGYRTKVVRENLAGSFPTKTKEELALIERQFYRHFCDIIVESIKLFTISKEELSRRCKLTEASKAMLNEYKQQEKTILLISGHCGNWEWVGSAFSAQAPYPLAVSYLLFPNKHLNQLLFEMRSRFGTDLVATPELVKHVIRNKDKVLSIGFISDQTPHRDYAHWTTFMHRETPVYTGSEKIAMKFNFPVLFIHITKAKRGYYEISTEKITDHPTALKPGELTELHTRMLELDLERQPFNWLWSHKRWKYKRKEKSVN